MKKFWLLIVSCGLFGATVTGCQLFASQQQTTGPDNWALAPLTDEQIASVKGCAIEALASERYADIETTTDLQSVYPLKSDCDWAVLAFAYADQLDQEQPLPESALDAFSKATTHNYGYAFATPIFYRYFNSSTMADAPAFTQQDIIDVKVHYAWSGYGDPVEYTLEIHQANSTPTLSVKPRDLEAALKSDLDKELTQALGLALTDLLPVEARFDLVVCVDNYPAWDVTLTFADDTTLNLTTASNFLFFGGPWFTEIDNQNYMQYSADFAEALNALIEGVGLPIGQPAGMYCFGGDILELAFP